MNHDVTPIAPEVGRTSSLPARIGRFAVTVVIGAVLVAISAQFVAPVPLSPVPMTLQPLAVLVVGGLFGAAAGVSALILYIALGALGVPVFAGGGSGFVHLIGPTGGYLLAFPVAAGVTGALAGSAPRSVLRVLLACALGMVVIHVGGVAQLALLGGDPAAAFRMGFVPFLTGDLLKIGLAAALILAVGPRLRPQP
ncbi:MAG TPA: biotin transporter BioY [Gemmatimonadales bacterium]|nr:biotin transporter BioY [Gemmatimonadales bacterium]